MGTLKDYFVEWAARDPAGYAEHRVRVDAHRRALEEWEPPELPPCPGHHRGPEGPNEDLGACACGMLTFAMRPTGETFGWHADDCSLPMRHESYCVGGGKGHAVPEGEKIRGYFPVR